MTDFIRALQAITVAASVDQPPAPIAVHWYAHDGLDVHVRQNDIEAWLKDTLTVTGPTVETFSWDRPDVVHQTTPCILAGLSPFSDPLPIRLRSCLPITRDQLAVQRAASDLTFEEVVAWFAQWPTLDPEQQQVEHREMTRLGVPTSLLPTLDDDLADVR